MSKLETARAEAPARPVLLTPHAGNGEDLYWMTTRDKYMIRDFRHVMRENQTAFWRRFGVTQTRGSRFERGKAVPLPVLMLMRLYLRRIIDDSDLAQVRMTEDGSDTLL